VIRRGQIVVANLFRRLGKITDRDGIATNLGVESTARAAADLQYELFFVEDAMTAQTPEEHHAAIAVNLPRFGTVCSTADVLSALS